MIIGILLLLVACIGISFAMVSITLDIKGKMQVGSVNWDVHFDNLRDPVITGTTTELGKPSITSTSTSIVNLNVKMLSPGDSIYYTFDVVNAGGLDAEISSIQIATPSCVGMGSQADEDARMVCQNIKYELVYENDSNMKIGDSLLKGETKTLKIRLSYTGTKLPLNEVEINRLNIAVVYSQK